MTATFTGAVLTGGASRRLGVDKALVEVNGAPLVSASVSALLAAGATEVLAIGGDAPALGRVAGIDRVVPDLHPGEGPLGGVLTALSAASEAIVVVLACDVPGIVGSDVVALVESLVAEPVADVAHAVVDGRVQPLTSAWRVGRVERLAADAFASGMRAPRQLFGSLHCVEVESLAASAIDDIDSIDDLHRYASRLHDDEDGSR